MKDWSNMPELLPPAGNPDVGERVFDILGQVIADKLNKNLHAKWVESYRLSRNQFWRQTRNIPVPLVSANLLHVHKTRTRNILTDNNPTFNISSMSEEEDAEAIQKLQRTCEYWWNETEQQAIFEAEVQDGEDYGVTIEKVIFNPDDESGLGEVEAILVDPFQFGFYPVSCKNTQKAEANLHFYPMSIREVKRRWPNLAEQVVADDEWLKELGAERDEALTGRNRGSFWTRVSGFLRTLMGAVDEKDINKDQTLVVECWVKDYSVDPVTGLPLYRGNIRCVTSCSGGKVVLSDKSNPSINPLLDDSLVSHTYLYRRFPFTVTNSFRDNTNAWGMSDVEQLEQLNREFNKTLSQMILMKDKSARPKIVNPMTSGVANEDFNNLPGVVNPVNSMEAQAIRYLDFPNVPLDMEKMVGLLKEIFFLVAGTFELEQAQTPGREVVAYKAIAALLERAATMMRGKIRSYSRLIRERGRMYLSHVQNWYTEDRWFSWEENGETMTGTISASQVQFPVRLTVVNGSTLPTSKIQQREEAMGMFKLQAIDQVDLLQKMEWNGRAGVIKRMREGPMGLFMDRMSAMGAPEDLLGLIQQIVSLDEKDFQKSLEQGQIPPIQWPGQDQTSIPGTKEALEQQKLQEEIRKQRAERQFLEEKANTERVEQRVKMEGIDFDRQKLNIERGKVITDLRDRKVVKDSEQFNPIGEKGIQSDNQA